MTFRLAELVQETTSSAGSPVTSYNLLGAANGRYSVSSRYSNGDTLMVMVNDIPATPVAPSPNEHTFVGTYVSSGNTITVNTTLKGSGNWVGAGPRNIYVSSLDEFLSPWLNPVWPVGIVVRDAPRSIQARSLAYAAAGGLANDFIILTNASGAGGNITHTQQFDPVRRTGGTQAHRTVDTPQFTGAYAQFTADPWELRGSGGSGDVAMKFDRIGVSDYTVTLGVGGSQQSISAIVGYPLWAAAESASNTAATIQTDTEVTISVPASGTWKLSVFGLFQWYSGTTGATVHDTINLEEKVGGAGWLTTRTSDMGIAIGGTTVLDNIQCVPVNKHFVPTANTVYKYRLNPSSGNGYASSGSNRYHSLAAMLLRVA